MEGQVENDDENDTFIPQRRKKGLTRFHITVEPIKFLIGFAIKFTNGVTIDMLERNVCMTTYNRTEDECFDMMRADENFKSRVEGLTADVNMLNQVVQGVFPLLLVLFVGPWSDTNGRKPFILLPLFGYSAYFLAWGVLSLFPHIPIMYLCIPSLPLGMTGTIILIYVCTWSYTCDNFKPEERALRFSVSICSMVTGQLLGNAFSGEVVHLAKPYGFAVVFFTSCAATFAALIYTTFFLEETVVRQPGVPRGRLLDLKNVKSMITILLVQPEKGVYLSVLLLSILLCEIPINAGDEGIVYLMGKSQYAWDLTMYNVFATISSAISAATPVFFIWALTKVMELANTTVLIIFFSLIALCEVAKALALNQVMFWISALLLKTGSTVGPTLDSELSKIVPKRHTGKAFTFLSICDALTPLLSIPVYTVLYKFFLPDHTLYVYFMSAILAVLALIGSVLLFFKKSSVEYRRQYNSGDSI